MGTPERRGRTPAGARRVGPVGTEADGAAGPGPGRTDAIWLRGLDPDDLVKALLVFMDRAVGGPWSEALAAADGGAEAKGKWNPALHPRDHRGRFVRRGD